MNTMSLAVSGSKIIVKIFTGKPEWGIHPGYFIRCHN
jgi:hypothetical protein